MKRELKEIPAVMSLTPGKLAGLKAVSDARGVIAAAAMDQRGSLQKSLAKERGAAADGHDLEVFKELVTDTLTRYSSAILLDPEYGLPASKMRNNAGLLLAYEKTGYDAQTPGRLPDLLDVWSVRRLKEAGADCIKILLYYTPFEKTPINDLKHAWIERIGDECRYHDIPFFLEFVGYDAEGGDEKSLAYAKKKPSIVSGAMAEFGKERYGVDVLKVEVPIEMTYVEGTRAFKGEAAYTRAEALQHFRDAAADHPQAVHLSLRRRLQPRLHRDPRTRRGVRHQVQRRPLRPRHLEGRHTHLRQAGREGLPRVARHRRRCQHSERQQGSRSRQPLVPQVRRKVPGRTRLTQRIRKQTKKAAAKAAASSL